VFRHTRYLEGLVARLERQIEVLRAENTIALAEQAERMKAESQVLHERDKAEIERLLTLNHEQKMRLDRLELSVFAGAGTEAGRSYVARTEVANGEPQEPPVEVESDQGTPWQRIQRRMIAEDERQWNIREAAKKAAEQAGLVPTPPEVRPGNDLSKTH
jgi:hypothetical protein